MANNNCHICGKLSGSLRLVVKEETCPGGAKCFFAGYQRQELLIAGKDSELAGLRARLLELEGRINTPHTDDWFEAVRFEAAHQVERFGAEHDQGKAPTDWLWLIGWLVGKACTSAVKGDVEKAKHHTISTGACLLNWFRALTGDSDAMRPGIADPEAK